MVSGHLFTSSRTWIVPSAPQLLQRNSPLSTSTSSDPSTGQMAPGGLGSPAPISPPISSSGRGGSCENASPAGGAFMSPPPGGAIGLPICGPPAGGIPPPPPNCASLASLRRLSARVSKVFSSVVEASLS